MAKTIYSFWQSETPRPAYLDLCLETWAKNIPDLDIVFISHANWHSFVGDIYDVEKLKQFPLMMQSDAVAAAVLATRGGLFFDVDTIITRNIFMDFASLAPRKFVAFGRPNIRSMHIAVLKSGQPDNPVARAWMAGARERILDPRPDYASSYLGNGILQTILNDPKHLDDYLIIDRSDYGNILETHVRPRRTPTEDYVNFYFNAAVKVNVAAAIAAARYGIISLHNSWTPRAYGDLPTRAAVLEHDCTLSRILKRVLTGRKGTLDG